MLEASRAGARMEQPALQADRGTPSRETEPHQPGEAGVGLTSLILGDLLATQRQVCSKLSLFIFIIIISGMSCWAGVQSSKEGGAQVQTLGQLLPAGCPTAQKAPAAHPSLYPG